ncbi:MAG TPA: DeoR/GlpR family DNA-binding transcription regulator [Rectinemataceae bacterium]|nr:DeoR/GlpR family DNA-binding transcription regulator [Rectinemataceae bacterium]
MNSIERKRRIMELLDAKESIEVVELARLFSISKVTARNDLDDLESKGLLVRTHGGAMLAEKHDFVRLIRNTINENSDKKKKICALASRLVEPSQSIIIDSGSTTVHLAHHIVDRAVTVITNSALVIQELMGAEQVELMISGGVLRRPSMSFIGAHARHSFEQIHADILFLGAAGVSLEHGITCTNLIEADTKQAMIRGVSKVCLLADSTKFGKVSLAKICGWDSVDMLITDEIDPAMRAALEAQGVQVMTE